MKKYIKYAIGIIVVLLLIQTVMYLRKKSKPKTIVYELVQPETKDIIKTTVATGQIEPRDEVLIKPQISGIIAEVYKEAGQDVKTGEVIALIKVVPELGQLNAAESRLRLARINLDQQEIDYNRSKALFEKDLISKEEYEKSTVIIKSAREEFQAAQDSHDIIREGITKDTKAISNTFVRSTIDGLLLDIPIRQGNSVIMSNTFNDGTTIASVANMKNIIFKGFIDETEVNRIHQGMHVSLTVGAIQGQVFDAILENISPKAKQENGANLFEIKAAVELPDTVFLRSGYSANANIILEQANQVMAIPERVVEIKNDSAFVYVCTNPSSTDQKFERKFIKTGISDGINIEVKEGLGEKEQLKGLPQQL